MANSMKESPFLSIILSIFLAFVIALILYILVIHFVVDENLSKNYRESALIDFYNQPHTGDIFVIGSSYVNEGVDANIIEESLQKNQINRSVFVIGMNAETPLSRVPELNNLIRSNPEIVIIGISYRDLTDNNEIYDDRLALISQKITCDKDCISFFNDSQLKMITQSPFENAIYKRKFIFNSAFKSLKNFFSEETKINENKILKREELFLTNFKDPWVHKVNKTESEIINSLANVTDAKRIYDDQNLQKQALLYTITKLHQNNISVILINMPINPHLSTVINNASRQNYTIFLNSTNVSWYDFEREYPSDFFTDTAHMNVAGRTAFSPRIADIIAKKLKAGE